MNCEAVHNDLIEDLLADQSPRQRAAEHLAACSSCSAWWQREQRLTEALRSSRPSVAPRPDLAARILAQLPTAPVPSSAESSQKVVAGPWAGSWVYVAAAASVICMLWFLGQAPRSVATEPLARAMSDDQAQDIMAYIELVSESMPAEVAQLDHGLGGELAGLEKDAVAVADFLWQCLPSTSLQTLDKR